MQSVCCLKSSEALARLKSDKNGLSEGEAKLRLQKEGPNLLKKGKKVGVVGLFFAQFKDIMTLLLIVAAAISAVIALFTKNSSDLTDTFIILFIILLNAVVGTVQQYRADKAIESLKKLSEVHAKVRRGGKVMQVDAECLVSGDIILLEEGDCIPADCRILSENGLRCDESALTGESESIEKNAAPMPEQRGYTGVGCALFKSTFVVRGNAEAVVVHTGMQTEIGKIADMIGEGKNSRTPLEKSLDKLGKVITAFVLVVTVILFVMGLAVRQEGILKNFMTSVAVAVAAIPEGLPAVVTVIMAMGVSRMSKKNVVIRKLQSVETLGGCNYICTDKTGTLTQNKMHVVRVWEADGATSEGAIASDKLLECFVACSNVKGERGKYLGDPTETALVAYADECGFTKSFVRLSEEPFTSERKMMSVGVAAGKGSVLYAKGAADVLITKCNRIRVGNIVRALTSQDREKIYKVVQSYSQEALRVLGFAYAEEQTEEKDLIFLGLCGMCDKLREGVKEAVTECHSAGIATVMITGDHKDTALAIARQLGIAEREEQVLTGEMLDGMSPKERVQKIEACRVFARVTPKHKNVIVKALQSRGNVVAMTGDGINDAPCIKSADIGIAMGKSGTDVTKSASDMVIADDNFATIVSAVREGRRIFANIKKTISFFLATNLAEVLSILIASIAFARHSFLLSTQLLWINLITDTFPVLAFGVEQGDDDIMKRPPLRAEKALLSKDTLWKVLLFGLYMTAATIGVYALFLVKWGNAAATSATFLTVSFLELFHAFNVRGEGKLTFRTIFQNKVLLLTVTAGVVVNVALMCITPLSSLFGLCALNGVQWAIVWGVSLSVLLFGWLVGTINRICSRKRVRGGKA